MSFTCVRPQNAAIYEPSGLFFDSDADAVRPLGRDLKNLETSMRLRSVFALVALWLSATLASGQDNKLLHIVVPFPAGGATDALARGLAPRLGAELGASGHRLLSDPR